MPYIRVIEPEDADGELREEYERLLAVVVSRANGCEYCDEHHAQALLAYWKDEARLEALRCDPREAGPDARALAILEHAVALTLITGYFNFVNRIAQGLGVEVSAGEATGYRY